MYNRLFTFGCSYTQWQWPTWADIIAYDLQLEYQNWGQPGIGNISIASKILECDLKNKFTKDDLILVNWSSWHRIDFVDGVTRNWHGGGNAFSNPMYPRKYLKKYWNQNNDIVKNCTAIIMSNKNNNIAYQSHMIDYQGRSEYGEISYDFTHYQYLLDHLPKKHVFDATNNSRFDNTVYDIHPDILTHLNHVYKIYKSLNLEIKDKTVQQCIDTQAKIINKIKKEKQGKIDNWQELQKFFSKVTL